MAVVWCGASGGGDERLAKKPKNPRRYLLTQDQITTLVIESWRDLKTRAERTAFVERYLEAHPELAPPWLQTGGR